MRYDFDEAEVKPYFALDRMVEAAFDCARTAVRPALRRRGPTSRPTTPTSASTRCAARDGALVGVFLHDNYARPTKRSGAWMSAYRCAVARRQRRRRCADRRQQQQLRQGRAGRADAASASTTRARCSTSSATACTGCCRNVDLRARCRAPTCCATSSSCRRSCSSTGSSEPEVLKRHARHHATGEPIPDALIERLQRGAPLQPGLRDGALHRLGAGRHGAARARPMRQPIDIVAFERAELERIGMPRGDRHATTGCRTSSTCSRAPATPPAITSTCGPRCSTPTASTRSSRPAIRSIPRSRRGCDATSIRPAIRSSPAAAYRAFRGRDPRIEPMLRQRGLLDDR